MAFFEEVRPQPDQVGEEIAHHLIVQHVAEIEQYIAAKQSGNGVQNGEGTEGEGEHEEEVGIELHQHLVHRQLQVERADQHEQLQDRRQNQSLNQGPLETANAGPQMVQTQPGALLGLLELLRWVEFQRDARKVRRERVSRVPPRARRRIVDNHRLRACGLQHDKMVQVPVDDGGRLHPANVLQRDLERPATHAQAVGHLHDRRQRDARRANRKTPSERRYVRLEPMESRDHREARQAALHRFVLADDRQFSRPEVEEPEILMIHQWRTAWNGSVNQLKNERRSRMMLPSSSMPGWSLKLRPKAITSCDPSRTATR